MNANSRKKLKKKSKPRSFLIFLDGTTSAWTEAAVSVAEVFAYSRTQ